MRDTTVREKGTYADDDFIFKGGQSGRAYDSRTKCQEQHAVKISSLLEINHLAFAIGKRLGSLFAPNDRATPAFFQLDPEQRHDA